MYSNGERYRAFLDPQAAQLIICTSEIILGKAIKQLKLPRDEIVVMTKVCILLSEPHIKDFLL